MPNARKKHKKARSRGKAALISLVKMKRRIAAIKNGLFASQKRALDDPAKRKLAKTARRAGKTVYAMSECVIACEETPGVSCIYIAKTRIQAEKNVWKVLKELNRKYGLKAHFHGSKLCMTLPNGSDITLYGADRPGWSDRLHGQKFAVAVIDEAAYFESDLKFIVDEAIDPATIDHDGIIIMVSTPGPRKYGYFWECYSGKWPGWSNHEWNTEENLAVREYYLKRLAKKKEENPDGWRDDPIIRRMFFGEFVDAAKNDVYKFSSVRNLIPKFSPMPGDQLILGIDFGWSDETTFSLCAYSREREELVELESYGRSEMLLDEVARTVRAYMEHHPGLLVTSDASNKQLFKELTKRYGLPLIPGERVDKNSWIELVNSDFVSGKILLLEGSTRGHVEEMAKLSWKYRASDGKRFENPDAKNDKCDAFLYSYRLSYHYRGRVPEASPEIGSKRYWEELERDLEREALEELENAEAFR